MLCLASQNWQRGPVDRGSRLCNVRSLEILRARAERCEDSTTTSEIEMMVRLVKGLRTRRIISSRGSTDPGNRVQALRPSRTYLDHFSIRQRGNPVFLLFSQNSDSDQANGGQCGRALDEGAPSLPVPPPSPPRRSPHYVTATYSTPSGSIPAAANMSLNASWQSSSRGAIFIWDKTERISTD